MTAQLSIVKPETPENKIVLGLHNITFAEYFEFSRAFIMNDLDTAYRLAQKFIASWSYPVSLELPDALSELSVPDSSAVLHTIRSTTEGLLEAIPTDGVLVDLSGWNTKRFLELNRLRASGEYTVYEPMLHEIATMEDTDPDKPLTLFQGFAILKAVNDKYAALLTGKN